MKLRVLKTFKDKENGTIYKPGQEIEVTDKRGEEILSSKYEVCELVGEVYLDTEDKPLVSKRGRRAKQ